MSEMVKMSAKENSVCVVGLWSSPLFRGRGTRLLSPGWTHTLQELQRPSHPRSVCQNLH